MSLNKIYSESIINILDTFKQNKKDRCNDLELIRGELNPIYKKLFLKAISKAKNEVNLSFLNRELQTTELEITTNDLKSAPKVDPRFVELSEFIFGKDFVRSSVVSTIFDQQNEEYSFRRPNNENPELFSILKASVDTKNILNSFWLKKYIEEGDFSREESDFFEKLDSSNELISAVFQEDLFPIITNNLNTICDLIYQIAYFEKSESNFLKKIEALTKNSKISPLHLVSMLPFNYIAQITHAGYCFPIFEPNSEAIVLDSRFKELIVACTAGGCPFKHENEFHNFFELFINKMQLVRSIN